MNNPNISPTEAQALLREMPPLYLLDPKDTATIDYRAELVSIVQNARQNRSYITRRNQLIDKAWERAIDMFGKYGNDNMNARAFLAEMTHLWRLEVQND